jgi:hypothetical protein
MPLDHTGFHVQPSKFDDVVAFYLKALGPLGYKKIADFGVAVGLGETRPDFWISSKVVVGQTEPPETNGVHYAFLAPSKFCQLSW